MSTPSLSLSIYFSKSNGYFSPSSSHESSRNSKISSDVDVTEAIAQFIEVGNKLGYGMTGLSGNMQEILK